MPKEGNPVALTIEIPVAINRAALADTRDIFVCMHAVDSPDRYVACVPQTNITVCEQPITGQELEAKLKVEILEEHDTYYLAEIADRNVGRGGKARFRVDKETGNIVPGSLKSVFKFDRPLTISGRRRE